MLEDVVGGRVATAAIAQQQNRRGLGIALPADPLPVPTEAVAGEQAGVVTQPQIEVGSIPSQVIDAMRDEHPGSPTGEVVIERPERLLTPHAAFSEELSEMLLGLRIHGKDRVVRPQVFRLQRGDPPELEVPIG